MGRILVRGEPGWDIIPELAPVRGETTVREANDRGFECLVLSDCIASYIPEFYEITLKMITAQGAIFGWIAPSSAFLAVLQLPVAMA
jgi:nicotinamidase-related amidase